MKKLLLILVLSVAMASCKKDEPQNSYRMNCDNQYPYIEATVYSDYQVPMNFYFNIDGIIYKKSYTLKQGENKINFNSIGTKCPDNWGFIKMEFN